MFFDKNEIDIKDLYKELQSLNNKLDFIMYQDKINQINTIPDPCKNCSNHPSNGGSGICNCTLGLPKITC